MAPPQRRGPPARHSLKWRLPATIALLIGVVLATFVWLAYRTIESTLVQTGGARLATAAGELARLLDRGPMLEQVARAARDEAVAAYLRSPSPDGAVAARARLLQLPAAVRRIELWSASGVRMLEAVRPGTPVASPLDAPPSAPGVGPLIAADDIMFYDMAAEAPGGAGLLVARTAYSAMNPQAVSRLVGQEAAVRMGNRDGSAWSDLRHPVAGPPVAIGGDSLYEYRDADGVSRLGAAASVPGTPWIAWVEFPRAQLVGPATAFLARMVPMALLFLGVGAVLAWAASERITRPIAALSDAAEAVAAGNYSRRLDVSGRDEVGRLAQAFNVMTRQVEEAQQRLEARVAERTAELAAARVEADAANRAKSEFLSLMSHDLRTPLNAILGFAQLLESDHLTPEQADHVSHILTGGRHLLALISDVLDITRIESGQLGLSVEPVAARKLVHGAVDLVRPLARERGISLRVDNVFDEIAVNADGHRLRQVLLNLLSNAVKYNRDQGSVIVSGARAGARRFRITVADTGPGLTGMQQTLLFRPFERLGAEQTEVEGTGLGLALARALAEGMGGSIGVASEPGRGSTFWVELGEADAMPAARPEPDGAPILPPTRGGLVLYVEDILSNVRLLQRILERRPGVELIHAPRGAQGIALARERRPDLVLLDLHLPDMSGDAVLRVLAADPGTQAIPKVVVSADATPGLARRLEADGALAFLTKPLNVGEVLRLVDRLLEGRNGEARHV